MIVCPFNRSLLTGCRKLPLLWWQWCFFLFLFGIAECFLQIISFMANLEVFATAVKMKEFPLDQVVSCVEVP